VLLVLREILQVISTFESKEKISKLINLLDDNGNNLSHYCAMMGNYQR